jgi:hypothetical protein
MIVEILSLFIPPLKSYERDVQEGSGLKDSTFATFLLALLQGYALLKA